MFQSNADRFASRRSRLFLWTFTHAQQLPCRQGAARWYILLQMIRLRFPDFSGFRVFERHPGRESPGFPHNHREESHGLHVHLVTGGYFCARVISRLCREYGWGRCHVILVKGGALGRQKAARYIGKYLTKKRHEDLKGLRLVGFFGDFRVERIRASQISVEGTIADLWAAAKKLPWWNEKKTHFFKKAAYVAMLNLQCMRWGCRPDFAVAVLNRNMSRYTPEEVTPQQMHSGGWVYQEYWNFVGELSRADGFKGREKLTLPTFEQWFTQNDKVIF